MTTTDVGELRQNAARYLRLVAFLIPAGEKRGSIIDQLIAAGQYRPAVGSFLDLPAPEPLPPGSRPASEVLREMRDEERW